MDESPLFEPSGIGSSFYQDLLEGLPDAVWVGELDGSVVYWNRAAEQLYGYRRDQAVGKLGHELLCSVSAGSEETHGAEGEEIWSGELHRTAADGRLLTVASRRVLVRSGGRRLVLEQSREVREDKGALRRAERDAEFLSRLSHDLGLLSDPDEVLAAACRLTGEHLDVLRCFFSEIREETGELLVSSDWRRPDLPSVAGAYRMADYLPDRVWQRGASTESFAIEDVQTHPLSHGYTAAYAHLGTRSFATAPFVRAGRWAVMLIVTSDQPRRWRPEELALLETVAARAWPLIERARGQQALAASEQTRHLALSAARLGTFDADLVTGRTVWNPAQHQIFGTDPATAVPDVESIWDRIHPEDRARMRELAAAARRTGSAHETEFRVVRPDGEIRFCVGGLAGVLDAHGRAVRLCGVTYDLTERKQLADEVHRSEQRLRFITDHAPVLIAYCGPDRRFRFANKPYTERFGLRPQDVVGRTFAEVLGPEAAASIEPYVERVLRGEPVAYETTVPYRGIGPRHMWVAYAPELDAAGRVVGFVSALVDITDRKRAEEALRASERQLSMIYESVADCLFVLAVEETPGGGGEGFRFDSINEAFLRTTGFRREQVLGKRVEDVLPQSSHALVVSKYREALRAGRTVRWEEVADMPAGRRVGEVMVTPLVAEIDGRRLLVGAMHDITALKQAEDVLREADRRKDEFLAMLAHELRNPLAPIRSAVEVLRQLGGAAPRLVAARAVIDRQIEQLTHLVDDLLDVSRITRGKIRLRRERVDLLGAVSRALESVRPLVAGRHQQLTVELPAEPLFVDGDVTRLCQVVGNLLHNASKFTDAGGQLSLRISRRGEAAEISVRDEGVGIAPEVLPRIFDLFTQADSSLDRAQGGLGIGLTLVRSLVELHGGTVEARSAGLGRGSEFTVRLPLLDVADSPGEAPGGRAAPATAPAELRRRILIVDDNTDAAETLQVLLELDGHETSLAHDGPTALRLAAELVPDAVLLDIGLPGLDGYVVAERLRARPELKSALLIALTGYGQEEDRRRSALSGFDLHLVKPVDVSALRALLRSGTTARR
ncbi:MAG: PAS domain S-box protein [Polyangia bacterium]